MAPQQIEKIEFAPGNGRGSEAADPQDVVNGRAATLRDSARMTKLQKVAEKGAQGFEIARCKTEIGACRRRNRRASSLARDRPRGLERPTTDVASVGCPEEADWPHEAEGNFSWPQTIEKSRNAEGISLRSRDGAQKPCSHSVSASPIGAACFAACAIAASAAWPAGWMRPADMISLAASSGDIGSSMMSLVGTKK
jgi:hypothetical protein